MILFLFHGMLGWLEPSVEDARGFAVGAAGLVPETALHLGGHLVHLVLNPGVALVVVALEFLFLPREGIGRGVVGAIVAHQLVVHLEEGLHADLFLLVDALLAVQDFNLDEVEVGGALAVVVVLDPVGVDVLEFIDVDGGGALGLVLPDAELDEAVAHLLDHVPDVLAAEGDFLAAFLAQGLHQGGVLFRLVLQGLQLLGEVSPVVGCRYVVGDVQGARSKGERQRYR